MKRTWSFQGWVGAALSLGLVALSSIALGADVRSPGGTRPVTDASAAPLVDPVPVKRWTTILPGVNSRGAPLLVDLDGDGTQEIVVVLTGQNFGDRGLGRIEVLRADGSSFPGWPVDPVPDGENLISSALAADVDRDGQFEVVAAVAKRPEEQEGAWWNSAIPEIHAFEMDGEPVFGFPFAVADSMLDPAFQFGMVEIGDTGPGFVATYRTPDGDGTAVVLDSEGNQLPGWPVEVADRALSPTAVGDLDSDGETEIALGSDIRGLYLLTEEGTLKPGWPVEPGPDFNQVPVTVGRVSSRAPQALVAASWREEPRGLFVFDPDGTRRLLLERPHSSGYIRVETALADIDGDEVSELILPTFWRNEGHGYLDVWNLDGSPAAGWPVQTWAWIEGGDEVNMVVADLDGDRSPELLLGMYTVNWAALPPERRSKGWLFGWHADGTEISGYPIGYPRTEVGLENGGSILGDVDGDGRYDLVMVRCEEANSSSPKSYVSLFSFQKRVDSSTVQWRMCHHDPYLTGNGDAECADGTVLGMCSDDRPLFCGRFWNLFERNCSLCGCPPDAVCGSWGWCRSHDIAD